MRAAPPSPTAGGRLTRLALVLVTWLSLSLPIAAADFAGTWSHMGAQGETTAQLTVSGTSISGTITEAAGVYQVNGIVNGATASGTVTFANGANLPFEAGFQGEQLVITLVNGANRLPFAFNRVGGSPAASGGLGAVVAPPTPEPSGGSLSGQWHNDDGANRTVADLTQQGQTLTGTFTEPGLSMPFTGTRSGTGFSGQLTVNGQSLPATITSQGDRFLLTLQLPAGQQQFEFRRSGLTVSQPGTPMPAPLVSGTWVNDDGGVRSTAQLNQTGNQVTGTVVEQDMQMTLQASHDNNGAFVGTLTVGTESVALRLEPREGTVVFTLSMPTGPQEFVFVAADGASSQPAPLPLPPQPITPVVYPDLNGTWVNDDGGIRTSAQLTHNGTQLSGRLEEQGTQMTLQATRGDDGVFTGSITIGSQSIAARLQPQDGTIVFTLTMPAGEQTYVFQPLDEAGQAPAPAPAPGPTPAPAPVAGGQLTGTYTSDLNGVRTTAVLTQTGDQITGTFSESGTQGTLQAARNGANQFGGSITIGGQMVPVVITQQGAGFTLSITTPQGNQSIRFDPAGGAVAAPVAAPGGTGFAGTWLYQDQNGQSQAVIQVSGNQLSGTVSDGTMSMPMQGTITGTNAQGSMTFNGQPLPFTAQLAGDQLTVNVTVGTMSQTFVLFRAGSAAAQQATGGGQPQGGAAPRAADGQNRDQRVIGHWRHTEVYSSDGFSFVSDTFLWVGPDGTYRMTSGGSGASTQDASVMNDGGEVLSEGVWRTTGNQIEVQVAGDQTWYPAGSYIVDGTSLMITQADGSRKLYERIN